MAGASEKSAGLTNMIKKLICVEASENPTSLSHNQQTLVAAIATFFIRLSTLGREVGKGRCGGTKYLLFLGSGDLEHEIRNHTLKTYGLN